MCFLRVLLVSIFFTILIPTVSLSQEQESSWQVYVYDAGKHSLIELTENGHKVYALPEAIFENYPDDSATDFILSSDNQSFVIVFRPHKEGFENAAFIIDLGNPEDFRKVEEPSLIESEFFVNYDGGTFSPDDLEIVLPYVSHDLNIRSGCCNSGGIALIDVSTGKITRNIHSERFFDPPLPFGSTAWIGEWTQQGIEFYPRCSGCTPPYEFVYEFWDRETDTIFTTDKFESMLLGDRLAVTGEFLYSSNHPEFPVGNTTGLIRPFNVVTLFQAGEIRDEDVGQYIYYDLNNLDFERARWVVGGEAFLVKNQDYGILVFRDGSQVPFNFFTGTQQFLAMTSNGWLMIDKESGEILHHTFDGTQFDTDSLYVAQGEIQVVDVRVPVNPDLPTFDIDISLPEEFFCRGFMPTRLKVGQQAELIATFLEGAPLIAFIEGDTSYEDIWPDTFSESEMERILAPPPGTVFNLLDGPVCGGYNDAYWKVEYDGLIGWVPEGRYTEYFLAPLNESDQ